MSELSPWKRVLAGLGLLAFSVWLTVMGLQTIAVDCAPGPDAVTRCVHQIRYAGITTSETPFTPAPDRISWHPAGKTNSQGVVDIRSLTGEKLEIEWLTAGEAKDAAARLAVDPRFHLTSSGPRWWLLFLLGTVPLMISMVLPTSVHVPSSATPPPVAKTRKAARAARGKAKKAAQRDR